MNWCYSVTKICSKVHPKVYFFNCLGSATSVFNFVKTPKPLIHRFNTDMRVMKPGSSSKNFSASKSPVVRRISPEKKLVMVTFKILSHRYANLIYKGETLNVDSQLTWISESETPKSKLEMWSLQPVEIPPPALRLRPPLKPVPLSPSKRSCCHLSGNCLGWNEMYG